VVFGDVGEQFAQCWREHSAVAHSFGVVGFGLAVVGDVQIDPRENAQAFCVSTMVLSTNHLLICTKLVDRGLVLRKRKPLRKAIHGKDEKGETPMLQ
jgi:hypothetical protein